MGVPGGVHLSQLSCVTMSLLVHCTEYCAPNRRSGTLLFQAQNLRPNVEPHVPPAPPSLASHRTFDTRFGRRDEEIVDLLRYLIVFPLMKTRFFSLSSPNKEGPFTLVCGIKIISLPKLTTSCLCCFLASISLASLGPLYHAVWRHRRAIAGCAMTPAKSAVQSCP